jgi:hypothetical protein
MDKRHTWRRRAKGQPFNELFELRREAAAVPSIATAAPSESN